MNKLMQQYRGSVAFAMSGPGPKPVFAPADEGGNGGNGGGDNGQGDSGSNGGNGGGDSEDAGSAAKGNGAGGDGGSARQLGGLFGKRTAPGGDKGNGDAGDGNADAGNDGPKLPDKFLNKDKSVNVDALTKAYTDLEKSHGELKRAKGGQNGGEVPETADGYFGKGDAAIAVPKEAENFKGLTADDPGVKSWAEVCQKRGIGKDLATSLMSDMLVAMNGHASPPIDPDAEFEALGPNRQNIVDGLFTWVNGKATAGELSEDDVSIVESLMATADGARFLVKMRNMSGERPIPHDPGGGARGMTKAQWDAAYAKAINAKDYAEQERLEGVLDRINPDGA